MTTILKEERPALVTERDPDGREYYVLNGTLRTGDPPSCTPPPDVAWDVPSPVCAPPPPASLPPPLTLQDCLSLKVVAKK